MRNFIIGAVLFVGLCAGAFWGGYLTVKDVNTATTFTQVPVVHLTVMSCQDKCYFLMVRDNKTGRVQEFSWESGADRPEFDDGESVDMELWNKSGGYAEFVYRGDGVHDEANYKARWFGWQDNTNSSIEGAYK